MWCLCLFPPQSHHWRVVVNSSVSGPSGGASDNIPHVRRCRRKLSSNPVVDKMPVHGGSSSGISAPYVCRKGCNRPQAARWPRLDVERRARQINYAKSYPAKTAKRSRPHDPGARPPGFSRRRWRYRNPPDASGCRPARSRLFGGKLKRAYVKTGDPILGNSWQAHDLLDFKHPKQIGALISSTLGV